MKAGNHLVIKVVLLKCLCKETLQFGFFVFSFPIQRSCHRKLFLLYRIVYLEVVGANQNRIDERCWSINSRTYSSSNSKLVSAFTWRVLLTNVFHKLHESQTYALFILFFLHFNTSPFSFSILTFFVKHFPKLQTKNKTMNWYLNLTLSFGIGNLKNTSVFKLTKSDFLTILKGNQLPGRQAGEWKEWLVDVSI